MRAMHVDAFFEYCLGHPHTYYTQLPPSGPFVSESRDGVPLEEDLALRALVPQWKPKRGRKRADERDLDEEKAAKRPQLDTSVGALHPGGFQDHSITFPQSAIPFSAFPDAEGHDPWMTASSSFPPPGGDQQGQDLRWSLPERDTSPANYPQSAIIPRGNQPSDVYMSVEPRSAVTPSSGEKSRSRRRHGPAVSSAWPNSNGSSTGKGRGRPPSKSSTSGSFSTFQVKPSREFSQNPQSSAVQSSPLVTAQNTSYAVTTAYNQSPTPVSNGRPNKLQLQVPQHVGAPVRLATPPTLLVNGVNGAVIPQGERSQEPRQEGTPSAEVEQSLVGADPNKSANDMVRSLSGELLQARITGRTIPLSAEEARALATTMVINVSSIYSQLPLGPPSLLLAFHLGVGHHFGLKAPNPVVISVNIDSAASSNIVGGTSGSEGSTRETLYSVSIEYKPSCQFTIQVTLDNPNTSTKAVGTSNPALSTTRALHDARDDDTAAFELEEDDLDHPVSEATWKQRYMKLRAQMQKKERALSQYKRKIVESVMADI